MKRKMKTVMWLYDPRRKMTSRLGAKYVIPAGNLVCVIRFALVNEEVCCSLACLSGGALDDVPETNVRF